MKPFLFNNLPFDLIREILLYDKHFIYRKNEYKIICINKIPKIDKRYLLFENIPKVYELSINSWSVILGKNKKFVICHSLRPSFLWEYSISTFSKDKHTNMMNWFSDTNIKFL